METINPKYKMIKSDPDSTNPNKEFVAFSTESDDIPAWLFYSNEKFILEDDNGNRVEVTIRKV